MLAAPPGHVGDLSQGESGCEKEKGAVRAQPEAPTLEAGLKMAVPRGGGDSHSQSGRRETGQGRRDRSVADDFGFGVGGVPVEGWAAGGRRASLQRSLSTH